MESFLFHNTNRSPAYGDEIQYLSGLLNVIGESSPENATALRKLQPASDRGSTSPSSPDGDNDDSVARTMRRYYNTVARLLSVYYADYTLVSVFSHGHYSQLDSS